MTKEERKEYNRVYYQAHKEERKEYKKDWYQAHKELEKIKMKVWNKVNNEKRKTWFKSYIKNDLNSLGQTKNSIRKKSWRYLKKYGTMIDGYEIHHCCTYTEPYKFIYCSRQIHKMIHSYLRQHNIDSDSDHYEYIKHFLDDSVIKYGI